MFNLSFLRHRRSIFRFWNQDAAPEGTAPKLHRLDEFPAGYSLAVCSPAWPASASPTGFSMRYRCLAVDQFSANGQLCLNRLSQPRGQVQNDKNEPAHWPGL